MASQFQNEITAQVALICENNAELYKAMRERYKAGVPIEQLAHDLKLSVSPYSHTCMGSEIVSQLYGNIDWHCVVVQIVIDN